MDKLTAISGGKELSNILLDLCSKNYACSFDDKMKADSAEEEEALRELQDSGEHLQSKAASLIEVAKKTDEEGAEISKLFEEFNLNVEKVSKNNGNLSASIKDFSEKFGEIMKHMDDIRNISEQTKLLSFNASIEAAHVGSAGAGFRIIANEVKKLSENAKKAGEEISFIMEKMQKQILLLKQESAENRRLLENLVEETSSSRNAVHKMTEETENSSLCVKDILLLIEEHGKMIRKVLESCNARSRKEREDFAWRASENLILFNDIISFSIELASLFEYLEEDALR